MLFRKFSNWLMVALLCVLPAAAQTVVRAGTTAVPWAPNISCSPGQFVAASPDNLHVFKAINLTPGTAANTQPTWNIFAGAVNVDGTCAWQEQGTLGLPGSGGSQSGPPQTLTNCTAAGTTLNEGVEFSTQLINGVTSLCGTTAAAGSISVVGVCQTGCGNAGAAQIAYSGYQPGIFDNQTTQNHYVIPSASNPGQFTDIGATVPASTTENVGIVASTNTGPGTIATIFLAPLSLFARGSSGGSGVVNPPGCANGIAYYPGLGAVISSDCNFTTNGQGDFIAHSGTFNDILHAGYVNFIQGPAAPAAPGNGVQVTVPTSVTGYVFSLPGATGTGCMQGSAITGGVQVGFTGSNCGAGAGSVTSFSAGTLSPLFTTSVANPTTTPALSFAFANALANSVFSNFSNSPAAPVYNAIGACGDSTHALSFVAGSGFSCQLIGGGQPTTTISTPTAPTLSTNGTPGATSRTYAIVGCEDVLCVKHTPVSSTTTIATTNATLSSSNSVNLSAYGDTLHGPRCYNVYRTASAGTPSTTGLIAACVGKKFVDTGLAGDGTTAPVSNNTVLEETTSPLPGCNIPLDKVTGPDAVPCAPNAMDDEFQQTFGVPGDVNNTFWTWGNQQGASASWSGGNLLLTTDTTAQIEYLTNAVALPGTPYTFEIYVDTLSNASSGAGQTCFVGLRESATGKVSIWGITHTQPDTSQTTAGGNMWLHQSWTSNSAHSDIKYIAYMTNGAYLQIKSDGTTVSVWGSDTGDAIKFHQYSTTPVSTAFTTAPNQLILGGVSLSGQSVDCAFDFERRTQ